MQGYSTGSLGHCITVHYNGCIEASIREYNKGRMGPSITLHYNG
jgi:hypothetical protein